MTYDKTGNECCAYCCQRWQSNSQKHHPCSRIIINVPLKTHRFLNQSCDPNSIGKPHADNTTVTRDCCIYTRALVSRPVSPVACANGISSTPKWSVHVWGSLQIPETHFWVFEITLARRWSIAAACHRHG